MENSADNCIQGPKIERIRKPRAPIGSSFYKVESREPISILDLINSMIRSKSPQEVLIETQEEFPYVPQQWDIVEEFEKFKIGLLQKQNQNI